jgi:hypothetical protein
MEMAGRAGNLYFWEDCYTMCLGKEKEKMTLLQFTNAGCLVEMFDEWKEGYVLVVRRMGPLNSDSRQEGNLYQGAEASCAAPAGRDWSCQGRMMEGDKKPVPGAEE